MPVQSSCAAKAYAIPLGATATRTPGEQRAVLSGDWVTGGSAGKFSGGTAE